jgi:hypothetical protein
MDRNTFDKVVIVNYEGFIPGTNQIKFVYAHATASQNTQVQKLSTENFIPQAHWENFNEHKLFFGLIKIFGGKKKDKSKDKNNNNNNNNNQKDKDIEEELKKIKAKERKENIKKCESFEGRKKQFYNLHAETDVFPETIM